MGRARAALAFVAIFIFAVLLIVMGFEGSFGRMLCVIFAPGRLTVDDTTERNQGGQKE